MYNGITSGFRLMCKRSKAIPYISAFLIIRNIGEIYTPTLTNYSTKVTFYIEYMRNDVNTITVYLFDRSLNNTKRQIFYDETSTTGQSPTISDIPIQEGDRVYLIQIVERL